MDQSKRVTQHQLNEMSRFIAASMELYNVTPNGTRVGIATFDIKMDETLPVSRARESTSTVLTIQNTLSRIQANPQARDLDLNSVMQTVSADMFGVDDADTTGAMVMLVAGEHASDGFDEASKDRISDLRKAGWLFFLHFSCFIFYF